MHVCVYIYIYIYIYMYTHIMYILTWPRLSGSVRTVKERAQRSTLGWAWAVANT